MAGAGNPTIPYEGKNSGFIWYYVQSSEGIQMKTYYRPFSRP